MSRFTISIYKKLLLESKPKILIGCRNLLLSHLPKQLGADERMNNNLTRRCIDTLAIQSAYHFCVSIGIKPSLLNLSMITGFSEERILEIHETKYNNQSVKTEDHSF
jgi:hypothetical protein